MKKRTKKPEPISLEFRKLPGNEEIASKYRLRMKAWRESNRYLAREFPKRRYYVVLLRNKETGKITAYNDGHKILSNDMCMLFTKKMPYVGRNGDAKFSLKEYRKPDGYSGHERAHRVADDLRKKRNSELYDIFVSRTGSKNCPIKVNYDVLFPVNVRVGFVVK